MNYLITGYHGEPHVTPENDRGVNAAIFGAGRYVLPVGEQFKAEYIGNNTVRLYDGKLVDNGAVAGIPAGTYVDLLIPEAGQGMYRTDLIVFQYSKDASTLVETGEFIVLHGTESPSAGTAYDPAITQEDLLTDTATFDQMPLWRVSVAGAAIGDPARMSVEAVVGVSPPELVWTNFSPTSDFANQTLTLVKDLEKFSVIMIKFRKTADDDTQYWGFVPVQAGATTTNYITIMSQSIGQGISTAEQAISYYRLFGVYAGANALYFGSCYRMYLSTDGTNYFKFVNVKTNNGCLIPVAAYGLKGGAIE